MCLRVFILCLRFYFVFEVLDYLILLVFFSFHCFLCAVGLQTLECNLWNTINENKMVDEAVQAIWRS